MSQINNRLFKRTTITEMEASPYYKDGKEYIISESILNINPLNKQGYHTIYQISGTKSDNELYQKIKSEIIDKISENISNGLNKFNDGVGEIYFSNPELVDCAYNKGEISYVMKFSTSGGITSGIILLNFYNYPDDILIEMSIWSVDYELEDRTREVGEIVSNDNEVKDPFIENNQKDTDKDFRVKSREIKNNYNMNFVNSLWEIGIKFKDYLLSLNLIIQIIILGIFLFSFTILFPIYIIIGIIYAILYFLRNKKEPVFQEKQKTKLIVTYDWSGIQALTQIRHLNFIKQKVEETITDYISKSGLNSKQGLVANYNPDLLKEGITKNINQNISNNFSIDLSNKNVNHHISNNIDKSTNHIDNSISNNIDNRVNNNINNSVNNSLNLESLNIDQSKRVNIGNNANGGNFDVGDISLN